MILIVIVFFSDFFFLDFKMFFSFFSFLCIINNFCFYENSPELCRNETEEFLSPSNYSKFSDLISPFAEEINISIVGNINYMIDISDLISTPQIHFIGSNSLNNQISFNKQNSESINITFENLQINLHKNSSLLNFSFFESKNAVFRCDEPIHLNVEKTIYIDFIGLVCITQINCTYIHLNIFDFDVKQVPQNPILIYCAASYFQNYTGNSIYFGLYDNQILIWKKPELTVPMIFTQDAAIYITQTSSVNVMYFTCLLSTLRFYYPNIVLEISNGVCEFLPCTWPRNETTLDMLNKSFANIITYVSAKLIIDVDVLPISLYVYSGELNIILNRENVQLCSQPTIISGKINIFAGENITNSAITFDEVWGFADVVITAENHVHVIIILYYDLFESDLPVYLTGSGIYTLQNLESFGSQTFYISNLNLKGQTLVIMDYPLPPVTLIIEGTCYYEDNPSIFLYSDIQYTPDKKQGEKEVLFSMKGKNLDTSLPIYLRGGFSSITYENNTGFPSIVTHEDASGFTISVEVEVLNQSVYSAYCFSKDPSLCPSAYHYISEDEYSDFPEYKVNYLDHLYFYIADDCYDSAKISFQQYASKKNLALDVQGNGNSFYFNGIFFQAFQNLTFSNVNVKISNIASTSNLVKVQVTNSTFSNLLQEILSKVPDLTIDYESLYNFPDNFEFESNITVKCNGYPVVITENGFTINGKPIKCKNVVLDASEKNLSIIGNCLQTSISLIITGSPPVLTIDGTFPKTFIIDVENIGEKVISLIEDPHLYLFIVTPLIFESPLSKVEFTLSAVLHNNLIIQMPPNSSLIFPSIITTKQGKITAPESVNIVCETILGLTYELIPTSLTNNSNIFAYISGSKVEISKDFTENINITLYFRLSSIPQLILTNGNYSKINYLNLYYFTEDPALEIAALQSNPYPYFNGFPLACSNTLACDNWSTNLYYAPDIFNEYLYTKCENRNEEKCYSLYLSKDILPYSTFYQDMNIIIGFTVSAAVIFLVGALVLIIRIIKEKRDQYPLSSMSMLPI